MMKKYLAAMLSVCLLLSVSVAAADPVDLSGMSFDELVALRDQLNLAIWNCREWQEVTVPEGVWIIGQDIPAGHWSVRIASEHDFLYVTYFEELDPVRRSPATGRMFQQELGSPGYGGSKKIRLESIDIDMKDGWYFKCTGFVIFTPYAGKPDLGFK